MARRRESTPDPFTVLGLGPNATLREIETARRELAKHLHPDVGGSVAAMQRVNAAADAARQRLSITPERPIHPSPPRRPPGRPATGSVFRDHPSFTIEALPAEAFEALLIVGAVLGDVIDDEPPYRLDVALAEPLAGWCRLELVPEAGASSIALAVAGVPGAGAPDLDAVRDAWIAELNRLDWADLDGSPLLP